MISITDIADFESGTPQFRINESKDKKAPLYTTYGQTDVEEDLLNIDIPGGDSRPIFTNDKVILLHAGDLVFSYISGDAVIVGEKHEGFLLTQNYVRIKPKPTVDSKYIAFLLNVDKNIKRQFRKGLQGSVLMKYTLNGLKAIELPDMPALKKQRLIGEIYFEQLHLEALKKKLAKLDTIAVIKKIKEVGF